MPEVVSIGNQDFSSIREKGCFYVDKTDFIREWWESQDVVTLITRPRRFGKTLNMSMTAQFFSTEYAGRTDLFEGLSVWKSEEYRKMQGTYPVLSLSFAGIKGTSYKSSRGAVIQRIIDLYTKYRYLLEGDALNSEEKKYFDYVDEAMTDEVASMALHRLAICMSRYFGRNVLILLDEYDAPLQEAYVGGYWAEMTAFIRELFNNTFKTNPYMERGLMTGITRVSKESIFSDMNNLEVITTTSEKYRTAFGFTEKEVEESLERFGLSMKLDKVKAWYDGFCFGGRSDIYNPWSITKYLDSQKLGAYWANTSSNSLVSKLIREGTPDLKIAMEDLLAGRSIETPIDEEIIFEQLDGSEAAIWSLLLASGYLKVDAGPDEDDFDAWAENSFEDDRYRVSLTNYEVKRMFRKMIQGWFRNSRTRYNDFVRAMLAENVEFMNQYMNQISASTFSFYDTGNNASKRSEPERFYHGFVLGLIVELSGEYYVTSNRESGFGRYDVMLEPLNHGRTAFVLEFRVRQKKEKTLAETVENALGQIAEKGYDAELMAKGILEQRIRHYGFAFEGKRVLIGTDR